MVNYMLCESLSQKNLPPSPRLKDAVTVNEFTLLPEATTTIKYDKSWNNDFPGSGHQAIKALKEGKIKPGE